MLQIRKAAERGHTDIGWLDSHHTFSFGDYLDERFVHFGPLRVINDDRVAAGGGFGTHPHRDMEIISYVLDGALAHKDSLGTGSTIVPGDVQRMTAGTGIRHSEFNASETDPVHFLQIWIIPDKPGLAPSYEQKRFTAEDKRGVLRLVASQSGREASVRLNRDADMFATLLDEGAEVSHDLQPGRIGWVQVAKGVVEVNGVLLEAGDGLSIRDERALKLVGRSADADVLLFDMADIV